MPFHDSSWNSGAPRHASRASAFTLLEMLLVLAILVAITAVTIPVVERMYDTHRIRQAATEVQTALSAGRLRAVDGGEVFECQFEPDGRRLMILPRPHQGLRFGDTTTSHGDLGRSTSIVVELPESLYFWTSDPERQRIAAATRRELERADVADAGQSWSAPIVFSPDGTSTSARFEIRDHQGRNVLIHVRGLTGAARTSGRENRRAG